MRRVLVDTHIALWALGEPDRLTDRNVIDPDLLTLHELGGTEITGALQRQIAAAHVRPIRPAQAA